MDGVGLTQRAPHRQYVARRARQNAELGRERLAARRRDRDQPHALGLVGEHVGRRGAVVQEGQVLDLIEQRRQMADLAHGRAVPDDLVAASIMGCAGNNQQFHDR